MRCSVFCYVKLRDTHVNKLCLNPIESFYYATFHLRHSYADCSVYLRHIHRTTEAAAAAAMAAAVTIAIFCLVILHQEITNKQNKHKIEGNHTKREKTPINTLVSFNKTKDKVKFGHKYSNQITVMHRERRRDWGGERQTHMYNKQTNTSNYCYKNTNCAHISCHVSISRQLLCVIRVLFFFWCVQNRTLFFSLVNLCCYCWRCKRAVKCNI